MAGELKPNLFRLNLVNFVYLTLCYSFYLGLFVLEIKNLVIRFQPARQIFIKEARKEMMREVRQLIEESKMKIKH